MSNNSTCDLSGNILLRACRPGWPEWICYLANICSLTSTAVWFLVLLPQVYRSFRHKSVAGISVWWAIANFTAAFNNSFFVFLFKCLPLSAFITAVYMPTLELILLLMFYVYTPRTWKTTTLAAVCVSVWIAILVLQVSFDVYRKMEWASIVLWSIETFPQVFLNSKRQSTHGLSNLMVALSAIGKTTDFMSTYLLVMPLQYVIMAWFSSSVCQIGTVQVLWYWNQVPAKDLAHEKAVLSPNQVESDHKAEENDDDTLVQLHTTTTCNFLRYLGLVWFLIELLAFDIALVWNTGSYAYLAMPIGTYALVLTAWAYYHKNPFAKKKD